MHSGRRSYGNRLFLPFRLFGETELSSHLCCAKISPQNSSGIPCNASVAVTCKKYRSGREAKVQESFFCCLSFCCSGLQHVYIHDAFSVISAFSFLMPPAVSIVLHFCPFTPYTATLPLKLYRAHTSFALQHTYTISTLQHAYTAKCANCGGQIGRASCRERVCLAV